MSYASQANLSADPEFRHRVGALLVEQAKYFFTPDVQSLESSLAKAILHSPEHWTANWAPSLATQPGFADAYDQGGSDGVTDPMLLSSVQALWPTMGRLWEDTITEPAP